MDDDSGKRPQRTFIETLKAIIWSFFGVRKRSEYEKDAEQLNPVYVIIAALIATFVFIATLIVIVKSVV
jgi:hypothetical protein